MASSKLIRSLAALSTAAMFTLVAGSSSTAFAAEPQDAASEPVSVISSPMHISGFDAEVATQNGFDIRKGADGKLRSVPVTSAARASQRAIDARSGVGVLGARGGASPLNTVASDCGTANFELYGGSGIITIKTGFYVYVPAVTFYWRTSVSGNFGRGGFTKTWGGGLTADNRWDGTESRLTSAGYYTGRVTSGSAILINGGVCTSGGPSSGATVSS